MRELSYEEIHSVSGGWSFTFEGNEEQRLPKVVVTGKHTGVQFSISNVDAPPDEITLYLQSMATTHPSIDQDGWGMTFPLTPNIPNEDALRMAVSNEMFREALTELGDRLGEDHEQIMSMLFDIEEMNQANYDALLGALGQLHHDFENDADASTDASDVGLLIGLLGLMRSN